MWFCCAQRASPLPPRSPITEIRQYSLYNSTRTQPGHSILPCSKKKTIWNCVVLSSFCNHHHYTLLAHSTIAVCVCFDFKNRFSVVVVAFNFCFVFFFCNWKIFPSLSRIFIHERLYAIFYLHGSVAVSVRVHFSTPDRVWWWNNLSFVVPALRVHYIER